MTVYFQEQFDSWDAAVACQHEKLQLCIVQKMAVRTCEILIDKNHLTGKQVFTVFVRPFHVYGN